MTMKLVNVMINSELLIVQAFRKGQNYIIFIATEVLSTSE
jgi:hypothetical protein